MAPFHLAFPVEDLGEAKRFYSEILGCALGREAENWVDLNFVGHQLSAHRRPYGPRRENSDVDGDAAPIPHFGVILPWTAWDALAQRIACAGWPFLSPPKVRFSGAPGEQGSFFVVDPSGNAIEFKAFRQESQVFATAV